VQHWLHSYFGDTPVRRRANSFSAKHKPNPIGKHVTSHIAAKKSDWKKPNQESK
jgi:hypothetical protein